MSFRYLLNCLLININILIDQNVLPFVLAQKSIQEFLLEEEKISEDVLNFLNKDEEINEMIIQAVDEIIEVNELFDIVNHYCHKNTYSLSHFFLLSISRKLIG